MVDHKSNSTYETVDKEFVKAVLIRELAERLAKDIRELCSSILSRKEHSQRIIALNILAQTFADLKKSELSAVTNELIFSAFQSTEENEWLIEERKSGITIIHQNPNAARFWASLVPFSKANITINLTPQKVVLKFSRLWQRETITIHRQMQE